VGTLLALEIVPYAGYGCTDTLYARLVDTLTAFANAGVNQLSCNETAVQIGSPPRSGFVYNWSPATGLDNATISNPFAKPSVTTSYELTMRSRGGGCLSRDTVVVTASIINGNINLVGKSTFCLDNNDSAVLHVTPSHSIQWYRDGISVPGATQTRFRANQSGSYHAVIKNLDGCDLSTGTISVFIDKARPGVTYPEEYAVRNLPLQLQARDFGAFYSWNPGTGLSNRDIADPIFRSTTEQKFTIRITTATECITIDTQVVKIIPAVEIFVPTAFTPNGDGKNDLLRPTLMGLKDMHYFRVFNRWGELVYETKTKRAGWDGRIGGAMQGSGVFVWVVSGVGVDGKTHVRRGTSALIR
jgi:gliding motility-associated-like protein